MSGCTTRSSTFVGRYYLCWLETHVVCVCFGLGCLWVGGGGLEYEEGRGRQLFGK